MVRRAAALLVVCLAARAEAGGFYVPDIGPRAVAEGGAMTARAEDASTIFHNPAGLSGLDGTELEASTSLFFPHITHFRRPVVDPNGGATINFAPATNTNTLAAVPFVGARFGSGVPRLSLGAGLWAPFGATLSFPTDGAQRFVVTHVSLRTIYVGPAASYQVRPDFSVGLSLSYVYSDITLEQENALQFVTGDPEATPNPDPGVEGHTRITARDPASFSATLGLRWHDPCDRGAVGLAITTPTTLKLSGDADVSNLNIAALRDGSGAVLQAAGGRHDTMSMSIPLPLIVRAGGVWKPHPRASVALDVSWQRWSTNDKLALHFDHNYALLDTPGANMYDVTLSNQWHDSVSLRLGGTYRVATGVELRGGGFFDQSPIDDRHFDVLTPDSDKIGVSGGVGTSFAIGHHQLDVDAGYAHVFLFERNIAPQNGKSGSDRTILNKPAPSFFHGITRGRAEIVCIALSLHL